MQAERPSRSAVSVTKRGESRFARDDADCDYGRPRNEPTRLSGSIRSRKQPAGCYCFPEMAQSRRDWASILFSVWQIEPSTTRRYWVSNKSPNTTLTCRSLRKAERRSESTYLHYGDRLSTRARVKAKSLH